MTAEEKVKQVYPKAHLYRYALGNFREYRIFRSKRSKFELSDWRRRPEYAWADAWRNIQKQQATQQ
jgi:hypothetical protein